MVEGGSRVGKERERESWFPEKKTKTENGR